MSDTKKLTVSVSGMHCSSCVGLVQGELQEMSSVEAVRVGLAPPVAELSVSADFSLEAANARLSKFGFALNAETGDSVPAKS